MTLEEQRELVDKYVLRIKESGWDYQVWDYGLSLITKHPDSIKAYIVAYRGNNLSEEKLDELLKEESNGEEGKQEEGS